MERYIIPFEYKSNNYYVFIEKHPESNTFGILQLVPETDEVVERQIATQVVKTFTEPLNPFSLNLQQTIVRSLASYLQEKGWPIDQPNASND